MTSSFTLHYRPRPPSSPPCPHLSKLSRRLWLLSTAPRKRNSSRTTQWVRHCCCHPILPRPGLSGSDLFVFYLSVILIHVLGRVYKNIYDSYRADCKYCLTTLHYQKTTDAHPQCFLTQPSLTQLSHSIPPIHLSPRPVNMRVTKKAILREYLSEIETLKVQLQQTRDKVGYVHYTAFLRFYKLIC